MPTGIHYAANLTTSALGAKNTTASIWMVQQSNTPTTKNGGIEWITILPSMALLVLAIICLEVYMRRKTTANRALAKAGQTEEQSATNR